MSCPFDKESLEKLKTFINVCQKTPSLLALPELTFFRNFIESLGGRVPEVSHAKPPPKEEKKRPEPTPVSESDEDEGVDEEIPEPVIDREGCVEPDQIDEVAQVMGDPKKEVSEEQADKSDAIKSEAFTLFGQGDLDGALKLITDAILLNPQSALLFAKRGQMYLKLNKPNACIRDCTRAIELNPDSATAHKFRGRAYRLLGDWEKAAKDLRQACIIDFDEQTDEWLKEVTPNAKKIEEYLLKKERQKLDKEDREKLKRLKKARKAHAKAQQQQQEQQQQQQQSEPQGSPRGDFSHLFQDPELLEALKDPEVAEAIKELNQNPMKFFDLCQTNPKISALMAKIMSKQGGGGSGGFPGFGGGFPGFAGGAAPGAPSGPEAGAPKGGGTFVPPDDDNLD